VYFEAMMTGKICSPQGPAGTGKTETMKDTANMLGRQAVVVSCSDELTVAKLQGGLPWEKLSAAGKQCPIIFDEFNRMTPQAMEEMIAACGDQFVCITFNPGYHVHEVPEVIKSRTAVIEMTVPDYIPIIQVLLGSEGVIDCERLGEQLNACVKACREKCSKQDHYDFGMRKLKSLAKMVGFQGRSAGYNDETTLVAETVCFHLCAMASGDDKQIVTNEVKAAFGVEVHVPSTSLGEMVASVAQVRHAVAVIGNVDQDATLAEIDKAMGTESIIVEGDATVGSLHGDMGNFLTAFKAAIQRKNPVNVVFRMPGLNAATLELFNTLFDDNKVYVTESGVHYKWAPNIRFVFFTTDCSEWTPAHISRCGMVSAS